MQEYYPILLATSLFRGVEEGELPAMLQCLQARLAAYPRGGWVFREGERGGRIMVLLEGSLHIRQDDYWGNRSILGRIGVGQVFGEAYGPGDLMLADVVAVEESRALALDAARVLTVCSAACRFHHLVVRNLFFDMAEKNRGLVEKLGHMAKRSTREKLMSYLSGEARRQGSGIFAIPFDRQELADFLSVDRSAMSRELGKMREEGLLTFERNRFTLL